MLIFGTHEVTLGRQLQRAEAAGVAAAQTILSEGEAGRLLLSKLRTEAVGFFELNSKDPL